MHLAQSPATYPKLAYLFQFPPLSDELLPFCLPPLFWSKHISSSSQETPWNLNSSPRRSRPCTQTRPTFLSLSGLHLPPLLCVPSSFAHSCCDGLPGPVTSLTFVELVGTIPGSVGLTLRKWSKEVILTTFIQYFMHTTFFLMKEW